MHDNTYFVAHSIIAVKRGVTFGFFLLQWCLRYVFHDFAIFIDSFGARDCP